MCIKKGSGESGVVECLENKEGDARKEAATRRKRIGKQLIPDWFMHGVRR